MFPERALPCGRWSDKDFLLAIWMGVVSHIPNTQMCSLVLVWWDQLSDEERLDVPQWEEPHAYRMEMRREADRLISVVVVLGI